jgi:plastocyanin
MASSVVYGHGSISSNQAMGKQIAFLAAIVSTVAFTSAACGGDDADLTALATEAAGTEPSTQLTVVADGLEFDTDTLVVPASTDVSITLENQDSGTLHNVAVYTDDDDRTEIFRGELFEGDDTRTYSFTSPAAGVYLFRCDAHPDMNGAFVVR